MAEPTTELSPEVASILSRDSLEVAPALLGAVISVAGSQGRVAIRLTEVEAYRGEEDPGSHAFRGRTARNASMFEAGGCIYVYFTYGMHHCLNIVTGPAGISRAVLLRGGEVVDGTELARERRPAARTDRDLARVSACPCRGCSGRRIPRASGAGHAPGSPGLEETGAPFPGVSGSTASRLSHLTDRPRPGVVVRTDSHAAGRRLALSTHII